MNAKQLSSIRKRTKPQRKIFEEVSILERKIVGFSFDVAAFCDRLSVTFIVERTVFIEGFAHTVFNSNEKIKELLRIERAPILDSEFIGGDGGYIFFGSSYFLDSLNLDIEKRRSSYVDEFVAKYKGLNDARGIAYSEDKLRAQAEENFGASIAKEKDEEARQKVERKKAIADKKEEYDLELKLLAAKGDIANYDELGRNTAADKIQLEISARGLAREMTDALKTEAMCQDEIDRLYDKQLVAAREKLGLEERATRAVEDQNRAKTLSNTLQDIILRHKIAELESEGKILAANKLKRELEIHSKLDSMKGLSPEKRKEYANMMRETNVFEDRTARRNQGNASSSGGGYSGNGRFGASISSARSIGPSGGSFSGDPRQSNRRLRHHEDRAKHGRRQTNAISAGKRKRHRIRIKSGASVRRSTQ